VRGLADPLFQFGDTRGSRIGNERPSLWTNVSPRCSLSGGLTRLRFVRAFASTLSWRESGERRDRDDCINPLLRLSIGITLSARPAYNFPIAAITPGTLTCCLCGSGKNLFTTLDTFARIHISHSRISGKEKRANAEARNLLGFARWSGCARAEDEDVRVDRVTDVEISGTENCYRRMVRGDSTRNDAEPSSETRPLFRDSN
jgi:hypothetical protein